MLALAHNWVCLLYAFVIGGIIFFVSIALPLRAGDIRLSNPEDRATIIALVIAFAFYVSLLLAWQWFAAGTGGGAP